MKTPDLAELQLKYRKLKESKKSLLMATQGNVPEVSYAPYIEENGVFYIFISELAGHTQNLLKHPELSVMFVADEQDSQNVFARERLIFTCRAEEVCESNSLYVECLDKLQGRLGNIVGMLRTLPDFHLFQLSPIEGRYIVGFGRAYSVDLMSGELSHIDESILQARNESN